MLPLPCLSFSPFNYFFKVLTAFQQVFLGRGCEVAVGGRLCGTVLWELFTCKKGEKKHWMITSHLLQNFCYFKTPNLLKSKEGESIGREAVTATGWQYCLDKSHSWPNGILNFEAAIFSILWHRWGSHFWAHKSALSPQGLGTGDRQCAGAGSCKVANISESRASNFTLDSVSITVVCCVRAAHSCSFIPLEKQMLPIQGQRDQ